MDISDIPTLATRAERYAEIFVDCYGEYEELAAMEVYFTDAVDYPFAAEWRDPDESGHREKVTVLSHAETHDRRGVLLNIQRAQGKPRRVPADQLWGLPPTGAPAMVLDDYRHWFDPSVFGDDEE